MIYNTPFQDLQAVRSLKERMSKLYHSQHGYQSKAKLGVFYTDLEVGLCLEDFKISLLKRFNLFSDNWVNMLVDEHEYEFFLVQEVLEKVIQETSEARAQSFEMAKLLRFRMDLI